MTPEQRKELEGHWMARAMRKARENYLADRKYPLFHILDAALMPTPMFEAEPWFVRPTQDASSNVGGVIRWDDTAHKARHIETVVMIPSRQEARRINVCSWQQFLDCIGQLGEDLALTDLELAQMIGKLSQWITHDDTADDAKDETAWNERKRLIARAEEIQANHKGTPDYGDS